MDQKSKPLINFTIIIALLAFSYAIVDVAGSYSRSIEPSSFKSFSVSAEGKSIAVPDIAKFNFSVVTEGGTNIESLQKENTEKMNEAIQFVKNQGANEKDIKTRRYSLEPRYQYYRCEEGPCPPPEIVGYTVSQTAEVKIRDFETIGSIISGVVGHGANTVSELSFTIDDLTEVENEARTEAIEKAKEKAEAIAKAGGFKIGQLLSVQESGQDDYYPSRAMQGFVDETAVKTDPSIEPGSEEVIVNITLVYEIK